MEKTIIDASKKRIFPDLKELIRYKDLFLTLTWRDLRVRYAQTTIGLLWAVIRPVFSLLIMTLIFGRFVGVETNIPHIVFTIAGLSTWSYFSAVMSSAGSSIIGAQGMVKKVYFPRLVIPLSKALVSLVDLVVSLIIMIVLMIWYGTTVESTWPLAFVFILIAAVAALAVGIWLSALTVRYRDFQHIVPFMVQIGMYLTPIAYPAELAAEHLPKWASTIYFLNPMAGVVQGFRWSLFGGTPPGDLMYVSFGMVFLLFFTGLIYFKKVEDQMADFV